MSLTAFVWVTAYTTSAIMAFVNPAYGLFGYFLDYYGHPPLRWWGDELPDLRWSLIISLVTLGALVICQEKLAKLKNLPHPQTKWLLMLIATTFIVTPTMAVAKDQSWEQTIEIAKLGVLYFLIVRTVRSHVHFRYLMLIQIVGALWWGWNAFEDPKRIGTRLEGIGGPDSVTSNATAAHLLAIFPLIGVLFLEGKGWERIVCVLAGVLSLNAFILCNSRGGFVALIVTGLYAILITRGRFRRKIMVGMTIGAVLFYSLMDPQFIERQSTIKNYEEDDSATSRLELWKGAIRLIQDYPLGTGGGGFAELSPVYAADVVEAYGKNRTAHNTYLLAAAEWGIAGFMFFAGFLVSTICELHRLRNISPTTANEIRMYRESYAIELGLIAVMVAGLFTNRVYAEAIYWLSAFTAILKNLYLNERKDASNSQHELSA